uniref:protein phosphatase Slingshot homolog 1-like n=1 Tax=Pristiophorus japonicus TaxID=55135 RepID=UPI00398E558F
DSFLMVQGSALLLPAAKPSPKEVCDQWPNTIKVGALQQHLESMCDLLREDETITLAVQLESSRPERFRYFLIVSNRKNVTSDENIILGVDITDQSSDRECSIGMVMPIWSDAHVFLDGDGGFSVTSGSRTCIFKPMNVQSMWTVLQALHKACGEAAQLNLCPGGSGLLWASYYMDQIQSDQKCINQWNCMSDLLSIRSESAAARCTPTDQDHMERRIRGELRAIMVDMDFEMITSKEIRTALEENMNEDLKEYKGFIDNEMLLVVAQMDSPSKIFDYLYLGSEWNAANLDELEGNG